MKAAIPPLVLFVLMVVVWQALHYALSWNSIVVPSPWEVGRAFVDNAEVLGRQVAVTLLEAMCGFVISILLGFVAAVTFVLSPLAQRTLYPYAIGLKATPLVALAPIVVMWSGNGFASKAIMASIVAFFPVLVNALDGLLSISASQSELMRSLSARPWQVMWKVRVPSSLPFVFSGLRVGSSLAIVGAIIGEFTGSTSGVGHLINTSSYYLKTDLVFAGILSVSVAGVLIFMGIGWIERKVVYWLPASEVL